MVMTLMQKSLQSKDVESILDLGIKRSTNYNGYKAAKPNFLALYVNKDENVEIYFLKIL